MSSSPAPGFGDYEPPTAQFHGTIMQSSYVTMRDGVKIAVQVTLPRDLGGDRIPALLSQTRYWRDMELKAPFSWFLKPEHLNPLFRNFKPFFSSHGYALVSVDVRGTGASFGSTPHPWDAESVRDGGEIVDWIVAQPWSNGKVAGTGVSYLGTTAELLAVPNRPAVKAILAQFNHPDPYTDIAFPGGLFNRRFITQWSEANAALDRNTIPATLGGILGRLLVRGVKPVQNDNGRELLAAAVAAHGANNNAFSKSEDIVCRDDAHPDLSISMDDQSVLRFATEIARAGVPIGGWASWMDAGTGAAALRRFMTVDNDEWTVIGAWEHGGRFNASPYSAMHNGVNPALPDQWRELMRFFDAYLKDVDNGVRGRKTLCYFTLGEERWHTAHAWPLPEAHSGRWYMPENQALSTGAPQADDGADAYTVDFAASSGDQNRWYELGGAFNKTVYYPRRAAAAQHMLTYLTPPLAADTEITGYPIVTLYVTSTATDGAFYVYLEDVAPDGQVTYITEGELRAMQRKVSTETPPYKLAVPYHSFKRRDVMPLVPGEVAELSFGLLPTSVLVRKDHRLRLGIAGHDEGTFMRIPASGTPRITVVRDRVHASHIDLPVRARG